MNILLFGAQASGKGTQAELLRDTLGLCHISSGDLFRAEISKQTLLGQQVQRYLERGELVPDELTLTLILQRLREPDSVRGALLDGFPRTLAQARAFDQSLALFRGQVDIVVSLDVPREALYQRIAGRFLCQAHQHIYNRYSCPPKRPGFCDLDGSELSQRADDHGEAVQRRLETFFSETVRVLDYYGAQGKVIHVNGDQAVERVHQDILAGLGRQALDQRSMLSVS